MISKDVPVGYKLTEVGVIPEDWKVLPIAELQPFVTSGSRGWAGFYSERGYPFIRITNLSRESIYPDLKDLKLVNLPLGVSEGTRTQLQDNDLLISITADIGIIGYVSSLIPKPSYINQHIALVRFDSSKVSSKFISYFLASENPQKLFWASTDTGAKAGMSLITVQKILVALPPLKEQKAIALVLSDTDALITSIDKLIAKKRDIKQAAMQQLLTGKDRWEEKNLGQIAEFINGRAYNITEWETRGVPVIRLQNLTGRGEDYYYSNLKLPEKQYCNYGDLLFMWSATFGAVIWKGGKAIFHYHIWKIECDIQKLDKGYLFYILLDITERLKNHSSSGGTMLHVTKQSMESTKIYLPPLEEQQAIAKVLSDMDSEISALEQRRDKTKALKQAMMQELLTGRIRLL